MTDADVVRGTMVSMTVNGGGDGTLDLPDPETVTSFGAAVERRQQAKERIKELEEIVDECDAALVELLDSHGLKRVTCQGYSISRRESGERRTIDPVKLLQAGVAASVIEQCTKVTTTKSGLTVRKTEARDEFVEWAKEVRREAGVEDSDE